MPTSACTSTGKAEGGTGKAPPREKKRGGSIRERPAATKPPTNATKGGQTPQPDGTEDETPRGGTGGPPS